MMKIVFKRRRPTISDSEFIVLVGHRFRKTTMLKMINQLIEQTDGNIY